MPRLTPIPIHYNGKDFSSRHALALHLAETIGRSWHSCEGWLRRLDNDPRKVIEHARTAHRSNITFTFEGTTYPSRTQLAKHLAELTGHPWLTCQTWLMEFDDDPRKVIEHAANAIKNNVRPVTIDGKSFPTQAAFARYLHQHYGVGWFATGRWLSTNHLTPKQCLERARAYRKKHRKPREYDGAMVLFGWHFSSAKALCTYYKINDDRFRSEWRSRQPGMPVHRIPACMIAIAKLWEVGYLDERNRHPPEVEARLPKTCLPTNDVLDEAVLDVYERRVLDCLQPADVRTPRRDALAWFDRMRQPVAS